MRSPRNLLPILCILVCGALAAAACSTSGGGSAERVNAATGESDADEAAAAAATSTALPTTTLPPTTTTTRPPTTTVPPDPVGDFIATMTVEAKVGQLLMPVLAGTSAVGVSADASARNQALGGFDTPAELVAGFQLGGIMYLGPNVESPDQIAAFSADLQAAASDAGLIPLLIAADQEGGRVRRIRGEGVTPVGSARSLAATPDVVEALGQTTALEMAAIGINVVFAPVADVARSEGGVIGDRSYGADPDLVSVNVAASIRGLRSGGAIAVAKHWPGHGATALDSHAELPVIDQSEADWRLVDRVPFEAAMDASVDAVMVGHLSYLSLDPSGTPATLSQPMVQGLLRNELGFDGLVVTDALDMGAVRDVPLGERVVRSVQAGVDVMLVLPDLPTAQQALISAVAEGEISEDRLDASVRRVLDTKVQLGILTL